MKEHQNNLLIASVYVGAVFAYPLLAGLLSIAGVEETPTPSVVLRVTVALLAVLALFFARARAVVVPVPIVAAFAVFWTMYLGRIVADGFFRDVPMPISGTALLAYSVTFSLLPALVGFVGLDRRASATAFRTLVAVGVITVVVISFDARSAIAALGDREFQRFGLEKLNPISMANVGGSIILLGAVGVFLGRGLALGQRLAFVALIALGAVLLVFGASRGPLVATALALVAFAVLTFNPRRMFLILVVLGVVGVAAWQAYEVGSTRFGFDIVQRFLAAADDVDDGTGNRPLMWANAWSQFVGSPIWGDAIGERSTGYYPHNLVLEAFMATGLVGGAAYVYLQLQAVFAALGLLVKRDGSEWLALLFLQYLVTAQTTGAHWVNGAHWLTTVAVIVTGTRVAQRRSARSSRRRSRRPGARGVGRPVSAR